MKINADALTRMRTILRQHQVPPIRIGDGFYFLLRTWSGDYKIPAEGPFPVDGLEPVEPGENPWA